jgi:hypothetical protein
MAQGNNAAQNNNPNPRLAAAMRQLTAVVQELTAVQKAAADPEGRAVQALRMAQQNEARDLANQLVAVHNDPVQLNRALRHLNQSRNEILVELINSHNPYTSNNVGDMSVFAGNPDPTNITNSIDQIELEVDGPYSMAMEWNFKGSPQKINKTIRLKYRYLARNLDKPERPLVEPRHWVTAYLLIGYEDGGA